MRTNILVQYQGGGYDGCFWEWNYFFIDAEGKFFDIASSGRNGITRQEDAESVMGDPHTYTYDVSSDEEMRAFARESNPGHVVGVVKWLTQHGHGDHAVVLCDRCGGIVIYPQFGDYQSEGGIVVSPNEVYCGGCADDDDTD